MNISAEDITDKDNDEWDTPSPYYYDDFYDWEKYNWKDRDNPLKPTYYMEDGRFPAINLLTSNLGVIAKYAGGDKLWVSVSDIIEAAPVFNAELYVYSYQLKEIGYAKTGTDGMAEVQLSGKPFVVVAKRGGATSYLKVTEGAEVSQQVRCRRQGSGKGSESLRLWGARCLEAGRHFARHDDPGRQREQDP